MLVKRDNENKLNTSVYRKSTSNDIYINWYAHAPNTWEIATLRNPIKRVFSISSNKCLLEKKIKYVKIAFCTYNRYTEKVADNIIKSEREWQQKTLKYSQETETINTSDVSTEVLTIILPYGGNEGNYIP